MKKYILLLLLMLCVGNSMNMVYAKESVKTEMIKQGSVELQLPDEQEFTVFYKKIGTMENGFFVLEEKYQESCVDLNKLQTAKELEIAAKKLTKYVTEYSSIKSDEKSQIQISSLEEGVYLFEIEGKKTVTPTLIFLPMWNEIEKEMDYNITVIPKFEEEVQSPDTGDKDFGKIFLGISTISLIIIVRLSCHRHFSVVKCYSSIQNIGGYYNGNDNDTENPRCTRRIRLSGCRSINRSKVRCSNGE